MRVLRRGGVHNRSVRKASVATLPSRVLPEARKLARNAITDLLSGVNPRERMRADAVRGMTVAEALEGYLTLRAAHLKPSTVVAYRTLMRRELRAQVPSLARVGHIMI
jgi:hypothetical protein